MKKRTIIIIIAAVLIIILLFIKMAASKNKVSYKSVPIKKRTIIESVEASGIVNPVQTVDIGTQVSGTIKEIYVDYNSQVKKGQLLAQIDPSLFQAQVDKARSDLNAAKANYEKSKTMLEYEKKNYERYARLYTKNYVSRNDVDLAEANYKSNLAEVNAMKAQINQASATLENNLTNLRYTKIISPVDGVVVEHVVGLKFRGVVDKVVVHGVFAHGDIGICDHRPQVNGLPVPGAGVNFLLWNRHQKTS